MVLRSAKLCVFRLDIDPILLYSITTDGNAAGWKNAARWRLHDRHHVTAILPRQTSLNEGARRVSTRTGIVSHYVRLQIVVPEAFILGFRRAPRRPGKRHTPHMYRGKGSGGGGPLPREHGIRSLPSFAKLKLVSATFCERGAGEARQPTTTINSLTRQCVNSRQPLFGAYHCARGGSLRWEEITSSNVERVRAGGKRISFRRGHDNFASDFRCGGCKNGGRSLAICLFITRRDFIVAVPRMRRGLLCSRSEQTVLSRIQHEDEG
ncbi:hypothetical protein EVAR_15763_1 [Eumeta japonica]|uniref:Uncharacterized protein n=1 Tax=Eumeta variegata TaxID=151549 RepID=A0A4C1TZC1_EUMVA|nr:hypothetical protein EVAR_15763_1 [Eumeta japonica]